jgi:hypothetical protein
MSQAMQGRPSHGSLLQKRDSSNPSLQRPLHIRAGARHPLTTGIPHRRVASSAVAMDTAVSSQASAAVNNAPSDKARQVLFGKADEQVGILYM